MFSVGSAVFAEITKRGNAIYSHSLVTIVLVPDSLEVPRQTAPATPDLHLLTQNHVHTQKYGHGHRDFHHSDPNQTANMNLSELFGVDMGWDFSLWQVK